MPANTLAWSYAVGRNAAKKLCLNQLRSRESGGFDAVANEDRESGASAQAQELQLVEIGEWRHRLPALGEIFRGRQLEVVSMMSRHGMTYRCAARNLGMSPHNVRRSFRTALERIKMFRAGLK